MDENRPETGLQDRECGTVKINPVSDPRKIRRQTGGLDAAASADITLVFEALMGTPTAVARWLPASGRTGTSV